MNVNALQTSDVNPTADEIERFAAKVADDSDVDEEDEGNDDQSPVKAVTASFKPAVFSLGDRVVVVEGGMINITGRIKSLQKTVAVIEPDPFQPISIPIEMMLTQIKKYFRVGDHVKVVTGLYKGETGMITQVNETTDSLSIYSDTSLRELTVASQDVIESSEVSSGRDSLGNYELHDLVSISGDRVGIIVKVDLSSFRVLTNRGVMETVKLAEIGRKFHSKFATALDAQANQLVKGKQLTR